MDSKELPIIPIHDFPEYNEDTQNNLWPVVVKYREQPPIEFFTSKSEIMKAFLLLDSIAENELHIPITIDNRSFEQENIESIHLEGRTYAFYG
ncbi:MAG: hypothetical protein WBA84_06445 [Carnobacterium sp.]|uniref:hypothetical protein n=1 Tax=Carnobacterium sp. TaxID=48221 RepID=UPI003C7290F4